MAIHHLHAEFDSLVVLHVGIIAQDEAGHRIGKALDDAGDNEQQGPKECIQLHEQNGGEDTAEVLVTI